MRTVVLAVVVVALLAAVLLVGCEKPSPPAAKSPMAFSAPVPAASPVSAPVAAPAPVVPPSAAAPVPASSGDPTVYVTNTGKKYHSAGCSYLAKSRRALTLSQAKAQGYTPCSRCGPPQ